MSALFKLSIPLIRSYVSESLFALGENLYQQQTVQWLVQRGDGIEGAVQVVDKNNYVYLQFHEGSLISTQCTCHEGERGCEHIVAVLLGCLMGNPVIESKATLDSLLAHLHKTQLQAIILALLKRQPQLTQLVEHLLASQVTVNLPEYLQIDVELTRRHIREALNYGFDCDLFRNFLGQITTFLQSGEVSNALTLLELVTEEALLTWEGYQTRYDYKDEGTVTEFFVELDQLWATAILSMQLSVEQVEYWRHCLTQWEAELIDSPFQFSTAIYALEYGWHYPPLGAILQGNDRVLLWETLPNEVRKQLLEVYAQLLLKQRRYPEYLRLMRTQRSFWVYLGLRVRLNLNLRLGF